VNWVELAKNRYHWAGLCRGDDKDMKFFGHMSLPIKLAPLTWTESVNKMGSASHSTGHSNLLNMTLQDGLNIVFSHLKSSIGHSSFIEQNLTFYYHGTRSARHYILAKMRPNGTVSVPQPFVSRQGPKQHLNVISRGLTKRSEHSSTARGGALDGITLNTGHCTSSTRTFILI
jgi:hypothetical protein